MQIIYIYRGNATVDIMIYLPASGLRHSVAHFSPDRHFGLRWLDTAFLHAVFGPRWLDTAFFR